MEILKKIEALVKEYIASLTEEAEQKVKRLTADYGNIKKEILAEEDKLSKVKAENSVLEKSLENLGTKIANEEENARSAKQDASDLITAREQYRNEANAVHKEVEKLTDDKAKLLTEVSSLEIKKSEKVLENSKAIQINEELKEENKQLAEEKNILREKIEKYNSESTSKVTAYSATINEQVKNIEVNKLQKEKLEDEVKKLNEKLKEFSEENKKHKAVLDSDIKEEEKKLAEIKKEYEKTKRDAEVELESMHNSRVALKAMQEKVDTKQVRFEQFKGNLIKLASILVHEGKAEKKAEIESILKHLNND